MPKFVELAKLVLLPIVWTIIILFALQSKRLVEETSYSVCGPWGCGPEISKLVAMHAAWLAIILPPALQAPTRIRLSKKLLQRMSIGLFLVGASGLLAIIAWQGLIWLPQASPWSARYIWQRCGCAAVSTVEWPSMPLVIASITL